MADRRTEGRRVGAYEGQPESNVERPWDDRASPGRGRVLLEASYRYAMALTHAHRDAEDLVHDAWLSASGRWLRPSRKYLYTAIRHRWIDRMRRRSKEVLLDPLEPDLDAVSDVSAPVDRVDLERALGTLRPREREAVYLMTVEGWTADEVAKFWDAPRGTVLSLVHRAKKKLVNQLEQPGGTDAHTQA